MDFITHYWGQLGFAVLVAVWLWKNRKTIGGGVVKLWRGQKALALEEGHREENELAGRRLIRITGERDEALQECDQLRQDLRDTVRKLQIRDDINRQDRVTITDANALIQQQLQTIHELERRLIEHDHNEKDSLH
jgi:hypothetical protein